MKIGKYISELLFTHETVILPGFGSFSTRYVPARFISEKNIVEAPAKIADFSPEPKEGYTPLTAVIAEREGMTEKEVIDFFGKLAHEINGSLQSGKKVELENIGLFQMDEKGEIHFSPDKSINYLKEDTGVSHVKAPVFTPPAEEDQPAGTPEDEPEKEPVNKTAEEDTTPPFQAATEPETTKEMTEHNETSNEKRKSSGGFWWLLYIAIPLLVILLILLLRFDYFFGDEGVIRRQATVERVEPVPSEPAEPADTTLIDEPDEEVTEPEPVPADPDIEPPSPEAGRPVYYIVVGSFRNEREAQKLARQLRSEGASLASVFMQTPSEYHRVCYGYYYALEEAENITASLDDELRGKAWILHR